MRQDASAEQSHQEETHQINKREMRLYEEKIIEEQRQCKIRVEKNWQKQDKEEENKKQEEIVNRLIGRAYKLAAIPNAMNESVDNCGGNLTLPTNVSSAPKHLTVNQNQNNGMQTNTTSTSNSTTTATTTTTTSSSPPHSTDLKVSFCAGCSEIIRDKFIFSVIDLHWHQDCVQCCDCSRKLTERCYTINDKLYCKHDYWHRFGPKCFACNESIEQSELVQRIKGNRVYHLKCFTCFECQKPLEQGEQLHVIDEKKLLCKQDYQQQFQHNQPRARHNHNHHNNHHHTTRQHSTPVTSPHIIKSSEPTSVLATNQQQNNAKTSGAQHEQHSASPVAYFTLLSPASAKSSSSLAHVSLASGTCATGRNKQRCVSSLNRKQQQQQRSRRRLGDNNNHYELHAEEGDNSLYGAHNEEGNDNNDEVDDDDDGDDNNDEDDDDESGEFCDNSNEVLASLYSYNNSNNLENVENCLLATSNANANCNPISGGGGGPQRNFNHREGELDKHDNVCNEDEDDDDDDDNDDDDDTIDGSSAGQTRTGRVGRKAISAAPSATTTASARRKRRRKQRQAGAEKSAPSKGKLLHRGVLSGCGGESILNGSQSSILASAQLPQQAPSCNSTANQQQHHHKSSCSPSSSTVSNSSNTSNHHLGNANQQQQQSHGAHHTHAMHQNALHHQSGNASGGGAGGGHKPTRVRTVLNEKQLQTLRDCYAHNPRPDAMMKERLVTTTGLSPRVIRVWFQNKRCKDKKKTIMFKQLQQTDKDGRNLNGLTHMRGVPLVAASPIQYSDEQSPPPTSNATPASILCEQTAPGVASPSRQVSASSSSSSAAATAALQSVQSPHEPQLIQQQALDIHAYQPPWKSLVEYAQQQQQQSGQQQQQAPQQTAPHTNPNLDSRLNTASPRYQQLIGQIHGYTSGHQHDNGLQPQQAPQYISQHNQQYAPGMVLHQQHHNAHQSLASSVRPAQMVHLHQSSGSSSSPAGSFQQH